MARAHARRLKVQSHSQIDWIPDRGETNAGPAERIPEVLNDLPCRIRRAIIQNDDLIRQARLVED